MIICFRSAVFACLLVTILSVSKSWAAKQDVLSVNDAIAQGEITLTSSTENIVPKLIIIIDDLGNNRAQAEQAAKLPAEVTFAVLPHTPFADVIANDAQAEGREIMLHLPMENHAGAPLGEGGLTLEMSDGERADVFVKALASVPHATGINNHMGSVLTENKQAMTSLLSSVKQKELYFVDSITSPKSVAWRAADAAQVPYLKRHIFLDHEITTEFIDSQFQKALEIANLRGYAVVIGHPYPETLSYLASVLETAEVQEQVELISASELVDVDVRQALLAKYKQLVALND